MKDQIIATWNREAENYDRVIQEEIAGNRDTQWYELLESHLNLDKPLKVLDIGCGPGLFSILFSKMNHNVVGVDISEKMIEVAQQNSKTYDAAADFIVGDIEILDLPKNHFDLVVCRDMVWTLTNPKETFERVNQLLNDHGSFVIYDANWNYRYHNDDARKAYEKDLEDYENTYNVTLSHSHEASDDYKASMPLSKELRPHWDVSALMSVGFETVVCHQNVSKYLFDDAKQLRFRSTPEFLIIGKK